MSWCFLNNVCWNEDFSLRQVDITLTSLAIINQQGWFHHWGDWQLLTVNHAACIRGTYPRLSQQEGGQPALLKPLQVQGWEEGAQQLCFMPFGIIVWFVKRLISRSSIYLRIPRKHESWNLLGTLCLAWLGPLSKAGDRPVRTVEHCVVY